MLNPRTQEIVLKLLSYLLTKCATTVIRALFKSLAFSFQIFRYKIGEDIQKRARKYLKSQYDLMWGLFFLDDVLLNASSWTLAGVSTAVHRFAKFK